MTRRLLAPVAALGFLWGSLVPASALDGDATVLLERTRVEVVAGPPGTPAQEAAVDRAQLELTATHRQPLLEGWTAEASVAVGADTLPSGDPRDLPETKVEPSATTLESWVAWEPLPGTLALGAGKRLVTPSSGFSHKPLNWLARADDREGRWGGQAAWFADAWSATVFGAPQFVQGRLGASVGTVDGQLLALYRDHTFNTGVGIDANWGDHLTLRAEAAAPLASDARPDALAGLTWTADDKSTFMLEATWDGSQPQAVATGFARVAADLDDQVSGDLWTKVDFDRWRRPNDVGGWTGAGLKWTATHWSLEGTVLGAWGPEGTRAGDSALRWKNTVEAKVFW